jgi:diguanylate cyclase (GGDEF)-like protein
MNPSITPGPSSDPDYGVSEIRTSLRKVERHDLWVWGNSAIIILSLTALIVALSVSLYLSGSRTVFGWDLSSAVRALVGLVLIFTGQMIYQHLKLRKIQRELAEQQIEAEVFRRLAMFDPLTGLYNRRFAEQRLRAEIARSERRGLSMIAVLLDLNDFKKINDGYGHMAGDQALRQFAKWLNRSTRGSDLAVRWGGDEFMLLLLDCEPEQLSIVLDRLNGFAFEFEGKSVPISFAVGWKSYEPGDEFEGLIETADRNLYIHKNAAKLPQEPVPTPA